MLSLVPRRRRQPSFQGCYPILLVTQPVCGFGWFNTAAVSIVTSRVLVVRATSIFSSPRQNTVFCAVFSCFAFSSILPHLYFPIAALFLSLFYFFRFLSPCRKLRRQSRNFVSNNYFIDSISDFVRISSMLRINSGCHADFADRSR